MRVELAEPAGDWDVFVEPHRGAALGHAAAWARVLADAYGLSPAYVTARDGGGVLAGVLPLVRFRTLRGRRELVSLPFLDTGGILASGPAAERALLEATLDLARSEAVHAVELRQPSPIALGAAPTGAHRVDLVLPLEDSEQAQWRRLRAKIRNQVRKAEKEGLRIAEGSPQRLCKQFYRVLRVNMRDLGSPVHAERFFEAVAAGFGTRLRFVVALLGERPIAGLVAILFAGRVTVSWAASLRSELHRCPNNLTYWEALRWAIEQGAREFDFGRSPPGSGTYRFKRGWGAVERPLPWVRLRADGSSLPIWSAGDNPLLARFSRVWMHLPVSATTWLGPRIRRFFPE